MFCVPNRRASVAVWGGVASLDRRGSARRRNRSTGQTQPFCCSFTASRSRLRMWFSETLLRKEQFTQGIRALLSLPRLPLGATPAVSDQTRFLPTAPEPPGLPCPPPFLTHPKPRVLHVIPTASTIRPPPIVLSLLRAWTRQPLQNHRLCSRRTGDPQPHSSPPQPRCRSPPTSQRAPCPDSARPWPPRHHAANFYTPQQSPPFKEAALFIAVLSSRLYQRSSNTAAPQPPLLQQPLRALKLTPSTL